MVKIRGCIARAEIRGSGCRQIGNWRHLPRRPPVTAYGLLTGVVFRLWRVPYTSRLLVRGSSFILEAEGQDLWAPTIPLGLLPIWSMPVRQTETTLIFREASEPRFLG